MCVLLCSGGTQRLVVVGGLGGRTAKGGMVEGVGNGYWRGVCGRGLRIVEGV